MHGGGGGGGGGLTGISKLPMKKVYGIFEITHYHLYYQNVIFLRNKLDYSNIDTFQNKVWAELILVPNVAEFPLISIVSTKTFIC